MAANSKIVIATDVSKAFGEAVKKEIEGSASRPFVLGLSGGSMPKILAEAVKRNADVDWENVKFVFCDERLVSKDDADSTFGAYIKAFDGVSGITEDNFVIVNVDLNPEAAAVDYEAKLATLKPDSAFDLLLLGMGPDGHTCSLFPGHALLNEVKRIVAPIEDSPKPPPKRVTLTLKALNKAKAVFILATGDSKKQVLGEILNEGRDYPIGRVEGPTWFLDEAAAANLQK